MNPLNVKISVPSLEGDSCSAAIQKALLSDPGYMGAIFKKYLLAIPNSLLSKKIELKPLDQLRLQLRSEIKKNGDQSAEQISEKIMRSGPQINWLVSCDDQGVEMSLGTETIRKAMKEAIKILNPNGVAARKQSLSDASEMEQLLEGLEENIKGSFAVERSMSQKEATLKNMRVQRKDVRDALSLIKKGEKDEKKTRELEEELEKIDREIDQKNEELGREKRSLEERSKKIEAELKGIESQDIGPVDEEERAVVKEIQFLTIGLETIDLEKQMVENDQRRIVEKIRLSEINQSERTINLQEREKDQSKLKEIEVKLKNLEKQRGRLEESKLAKRMQQILLIQKRVKKRIEELEEELQKEIGGKIEGVLTLANLQVGKKEREEEGEIEEQIKRGNKRGEISELTIQKNPKLAEPESMETIGESRLSIRKKLIELLQKIDSEENDIEEERKEIKKEERKQQDQLEERDQEWKKLKNQLEEIKQKLEIKLGREFLFFDQ